MADAEAKTPEPEVQRMLILSTCHLSPDDAKFLQDHLEEYALSSTDGATHPDGPMVAPYAYGWIMWVDDAVIGEEVEHPFSEHVVACLKKADELGCEWVRFDCDGPEFDGLQVFDW